MYLNHILDEHGWNTSPKNEQACLGNLIYPDSIHDNETIEGPMKATKIAELEPMMVFSYH